MDLRNNPDLQPFIDRVNPRQLANLENKCKMLEKANNEMTQEILRIQNELHRQQTLVTRDACQQVPEDFVDELAEDALNTP